jgi:hypothetical protein
VDGIAVRAVGLLEPAQFVFGARRESNRSGFFYRKIEIHDDARFRFYAAA